MANQYICSRCSKELANRHSLSRHKKNCCKSSKSQDSLQYHDLLSNCMTEDITKPPVSDPQVSAMRSGESRPEMKQPTPKITALVDAILNDGIIDTKDEPVVKKAKKLQLPLDPPPEFTKMSPHMIPPIDIQHLGNSIEEEDEDESEEDDDDDDSSMDADDSYKIRYNDLPVVDDGAEDVSITLSRPIIA